MATTVVELTADETKLLRSYRKVAEEQAKQEKGFKGMADASQKAGAEIAGNLDKAGQESAKAFTEILRELRKMGPEGRQMASELEAHLRDTGKGGRQSMQQIIGKLEELDPAAAEVARKVEGSLKVAANDSARNLGKVQKELIALGPEGKAVANRLSEYLAQTGESGKRSIDEIIREVGLIDNEAEEVAIRAREDFAGMKSAGDGAFGDSAARKVIAFAGTWMSVSRAVNAVYDALERMREKKEEALGTLQGTEDENRRLLQVSTSQDDYEQLRDRADELALQHGIDRNQARQLIFSARSENFEPAAEFIASNAQVIGVESQAKVAGQLPGLFKNETVTPEQAINMTLAGAAESRLNFEDIATALPSAAEGGALAGASSVETVGALSVLAGRFKSGETAADRLKNLATKIGLDTGVSEEDIKKDRQEEQDRLEAATARLRSLEERAADAKKDLDRERMSKKPSTERIADLETRLQRTQRAVREFDRSQLQLRNVDPSAVVQRGLSGLGIVEAVRVLRDEYTEAERKDFLGDSQEANAAYKILVEEFDAVADRIAVIRAAREATGTEASPTAQRRSFAQSDPAMRALLAERRAKIQQEMANEDRRAIPEAKKQSAVSTALADADRSGASGMSQHFAETVASSFSLFGMDDDRFQDWLVSSLSGDPLAAVIGEATNSIARPDQSVQQRDQLVAVAFAATKLQQARRETPGGEAVLGASDVAKFLQKSLGQSVSEEDVTDDARQRVTQMLRDLEEEKAIRLNTVDPLLLPPEMQGRRFRDSLLETSEIAQELAPTVGQREAVVRDQDGSLRAELPGRERGAANEEERREARETAKRQEEQMAKMTAALEKANELQQQTAEAAKETAANTAPGPSSVSPRATAAAQSAAAAASAP